MSAMTLVASSRHTGNMPVAMGSRVPTWPALFARQALRRRCSAPFEVSPGGLSSRMMPLGMASASPSGSLVLVVIRLHRAIDEAGELVGVFDLLVVDELELRRVPQLQGTAKLAAQESRCARQALAHFLGRVFAAEWHEPDARGG